MCQQEQYTQFLVVLQGPGAGWVENSPFSLPQSPCILYAVCFQEVPPWLNPLCRCPSPRWRGSTGWLFRRVHHSRFPGLARYYTPFSAPTADSPLTGRGLNDVLPEHNEGVPVVPQLLTNKADDFISAARRLQDLGYNEVNLNLGCPSGTVVSKKKGAGFLSDPQGIDAFLDTVFRRLDMTVSVKTRIGVSDPDEWPALLEMFARYPISLLIIHPRLRTDYYKGDVRQEAFAYAVAKYKGPLCYNGDLNTVSDCQRVTACYPRLSELMAGRGLVADPALGRALAGGPPLTQAEFLAFHDELVAGYQEDPLRRLAGLRQDEGALDLLGQPLPRAAEAAEGHAEGQNAGGLPRRSAAARGGAGNGVRQRQRDFITGSVGHVVALVHNRFLAERGPHPSASRPPSPLGKALPTQHKLEGSYLSMINGTIQSLPQGGRWPGSSRVG